jgi:hypothetical protein
MTQRTTISLVIVGCIVLGLVGYFVTAALMPQNNAAPNGVAQPKILGGSAGTPNTGTPNAAVPNGAVTNNTNPPQMVGNDRDAHGCIGSAGYVWCPEKNKCLRTWEEACAHPSLPTKPQPE